MVFFCRFMQKISPETLKKIKKTDLEVSSLFRGEKEYTQMIADSTSVDTLLPSKASSTKVHTLEHF